jgi:fucose 4-O-acetylase-like acetyltransferase
MRDLVRDTPAYRQRHIDLFRVIAIAAVVTGHWLVMAVGYGPSGLTGTSALAQLAWAHPLTWVFQVMPVFFMVGGFANAASLASHRRGGGDATAWLLTRSARLMPPTTVLLLVVAATAGIARLAGTDARLVDLAVRVACLPLWFLGAYLAVILLAPLMYAWHERSGLLVVGGLVGLVALGDLARWFSGLEMVAYGNYAFAWLAAHQVGFAWYDGRLAARRAVALPLLVTGLAALLLLTTVGPYPVSLVTVPGASVDNTAPPTLALIALATVQCGLALLVRDRAETWLRGHQRSWMLVAAANSVILTVFLWHMNAAVIVTVGLHLAGLLPAVPVDSAAWLLWRIPWLALLGLVLAALVMLLGRLESRRRKPWPVPATVSALLARRGMLKTLTWIGFLAVVVSLLVQALTATATYDPLGVPTITLVAFLAGAALLRLARSVRL